MRELQLAVSFKSLQELIFTFFSTATATANCQKLFEISSDVGKSHDPQPDLAVQS